MHRKRTTNSGGATSAAFARPWLVPLAIVAVLASLLMAIWAAAPGQAHESPTDCDANDFTQTIQRSQSDATAGDTITFTVRIGNPDLSGNGCDVTVNSVELTTPDGVEHELLAAPEELPHDTDTFVLDTVDYVADNADASGGEWTATTVATGDLHSDEDEEPFSDDKQISVDQVLPLDVEKDAVPTFDREFPWEIVKSVDPDTWNLFDGDTATSDYTVEVTKGDAVDSNWAVTGTITITNPNTDFAIEITGVSDVITPGPIEADVVCDETLPHTLAGGETLECTYSHDFASDPGDETFTNTATVEAEEDAGGAGATVLQLGGDPGTDTFDFTGDPENVINDEVTITDTNEPEFGGPHVIDESETFEYSVQFDCSEVDFVEGFGEFTHENTAEIEETEQTSMADVDVDCYQLDVVKDIEGTLDLAYDWMVEKTADPGEQTIGFGESADVTWTVTVDLTEDSPTASNIVISGDITISNPNPTRDADLTEVVDELDGQDVAVDCPSLTVPADDDLVCTYEAEFDTAGDFDNVATATQQNYDFASDGTPTETGTTDYTGEASLLEGDITVANEEDFCTDVVDTELGLNETVCADDTLPAVFSDPVTYGPEDLVCGENVVENTATITEEDTEETSSSTATSTIIVECNPSTDLSASADPAGPVTPGTDVTFTFTETNDGDVPLTDVDVTTDLTGCEDPDLVSGSATLNPTESAEFECTVTINDTTTVVALGFGTDPEDNVVRWCNEDEEASTPEGVICDQDEIAEITVEVEEEFQGCTPGFWRTHSSFAPGNQDDLWVGLEADDLFNDTFEVDWFDDDETLQDIMLQPGGLRTLGFHVIAAQLNINSIVEYGLTQDELDDIIDDVNPDDQTSVSEAIDILTEHNEAGCPDASEFPVTENEDEDEDDNEPGPPAGRGGPRG